MILHEVRDIAEIQLKHVFPSLLFSVIILLSFWNQQFPATGLIYTSTSF